MRDALAGVFADAAPDSWGRRLFERAYGNGLNEFEYMTLSDDTCRQGALRFLDDKGEVIRGKAPWSWRGGVFRDRESGRGAAGGRAAAQPTRAGQRPSPAPHAKAAGAIQPQWPRPETSVCTSAMAPEIGRNCPVAALSTKKAIFACRASGLCGASVIARTCLPLS